MSEEYTVCTADIRNRIHEAGIFRPDERIILTTKSCVLLEHFTGRTYSYRRVDLHTLKAKRLFSRPTPLSEAGYRRAIEKMAALPDGASPFMQDASSRAGELLAHVFHDILPEHGLALRESQLSLSLAMLEAMEKGKVALCEAEVGTGKTHAYLIAAAIYWLFHREGQPVVISTSTIALQKALTEEYIPQISGILLEHRIIGEPLTFAVRKGKSHYACDSRVKTYLSSIKHNNRPEDGKLIEALTALFVGAASLDLDGQPLTDYVKERICVEDCRGTCGLSSVCRYRAFLRKSNQGRVDFQIANHNLVLADVLSRKGEANPGSEQGIPLRLPEPCLAVPAGGHAFSRCQDSGVPERGDGQAGRAHPAEPRAYAGAVHILPDDGDSASGACREDRRCGNLYPWLSL